MENVPTVSNSKNFWVCFVITSTLMNHGYGASYFSVTFGQPNFQHYMKLAGPDAASNVDSLIGAMSGLNMVGDSCSSASLISTVLTSHFDQAGGFFGVLSLAWVMDHWGRRAGLAYCAALSILGRTMCAAAQNVGMFIAFRFFDGAGTFATFIAGKMRTLSRELLTLSVAHANDDMGQSPSSVLSFVRRDIVVSSSALEACSLLWDIP